MLDRRGSFDDRYKVPLPQLVLLQLSCRCRYFGVRETARAESRDPASGRNYPPSQSSPLRETHLSPPAVMSRESQAALVERILVFLEAWVHQVPRISFPLLPFPLPRASPSARF